MKVVGLDGKYYSLNFGKYATQRGVGSQYHETAKQLLVEMFPCNIIYEEVVLPGTNSLRADLFIPTQNMVVEVHGEQHYKDSTYFFPSYQDYIHAKRRDNDKKEWCLLNKIRYVELPYKESIDEWKRRLC